MSQTLAGSRRGGRATDVASSGWTLCCHVMGIFPLIRRRRRLEGLYLDTMAITSRRQRNSQVALDDDPQERHLRRHLRPEGADGLDRDPGFEDHEDPSGQVTSPSAVPTRSLWNIAAEIVPIGPHRRGTDTRDVASLDRAHRFASVSRLKVW